MQLLLENLKTELSGRESTDNGRVLAKVIAQLQTVKNTQLEKVLESLNWAKLLNWCRLCVEQGAVDDESRLAVANEVAGWTGAYDTVMASWGAWWMLLRAKGD